MNLSIEQEQQLAGVIKQYWKTLLPRLDVPTQEQFLVWAGTYDEGTIRHGIRRTAAKNFGLNGTMTFEDCLKYASGVMYNVVKNGGQLNEIKRKSLKEMADDPDVIAWRAASASVKSWEAERDRLLDVLNSPDETLDICINENTRRKNRELCADAKYGVKYWRDEYARLDKIVDAKRIRLAQEEGQ
jgi:hypothetical protein